MFIPFCILPVKCAPAAVLSQVEEELDTISQLFITQALSLTVKNYESTGGVGGEIVVPPSFCQNARLAEYVAGAI